MGLIAKEQKDYLNAEKWYRKSLEIKERQGNEHGAATTYHQLGIIAQQQRDFQTAEKWYRKSLEIFERQDNEHGAANTYGQLGILAGLKEEYELSGQWLIRSIQGFANTGDDSNAHMGSAIFVTNYQATSPPIQNKLKTMWNQAGLGDFESLIKNMKDSELVS